jgi:hypothetical protein
VALELRLPVNCGFLLMFKTGQMGQMRMITIFGRVPLRSRIGGPFESSERIPEGLTKRNFGATAGFLIGRRPGAILADNPALQSLNE